MTNIDSIDGVDGAALPTAVVTKRRGVLQSRVWILTGFALLLAIWLAWSSMPKPGTRISIHFPDGHGLRAGDPVRYRGIDVGTVRGIQLGRGDGVDVSVTIDQSAKSLLSNGANFWIVRPKLALSGVSGLETAVGPKYIAVEPDSLTLESAPREFSGLAEAPQQVGERRGTEIVFQADEQFGVNAGSAVTYRGFEVGKILDVRLSDDSRFVNFRAIIRHPHQRLVTSESRFWANSGIDVDFSLREGLSLDTDSLETIARGGVSFLTVDTAGEKLTAGQVFPLYRKPKDQWLEKANKIRLPTVDLKGAVTLVIKTSRFGLLGNREVTRLASAVPVQTESGQRALIVPTNLLMEFNANKLSAKSVTIDGLEKDSFDQWLFEAFVDMASAGGGKSGTLPVIVLPIDAAIDLPWQKLTAAGIENQPLIAVRHPVGASDGTFVHLPIDWDQLVIQRDGIWKVPEFEGDEDLWNGSPILSVDSGEVVGVMVSDNSWMTIVPLARLRQSVR